MIYYMRNNCRQFTISGKENAMKASTFICSILILLLVCIVSLVSCKKQIATEEKECFCSDGTVSIQACRVDGSGCESCECTEYSIWCDPDTSLCWQDPQREAFNYDDLGVTAKEAGQY